MLRSLLITAFVTYVFLLLTMVWAHKHPGHRPVAHRYNLAPLRSIARDIPQGGRGLWLNIVGNVVVFTPIGLAVYGLRGARSSIWQAALAAAALSTLIEVVQFQSGRRYSDIDDVILNTLGGVAGYVAALAIGSLYVRWRPRVAG
ncbi:MAG: VanZ family protein [Paludisphaera borealis]|uniref:VanZ family protein n=1 Tax=Paludisphaera borealis TaxID=1387353 RepID=UPI00283AE2ED|nr:VanZ family protein [Paludisphaera borealis]MDR3618964.1 VanZ family protein [Paludisphaera borealis]